MIMRKLVPTLMMLALVACSGPKTKPLTGNSLKSPDGRLELKVGVVDGVPMYSLQKDGADVVLPSRLGFDLLDREDLKDGFTLTDVESGSRSGAKKHRSGTITTKCSSA